MLFVILWHRKLCAVLDFCLNVILTCEKYHLSVFLLKIDLWLYVAKDAFVHYSKGFSVKWNNVLLQWFLPFQLQTIRPDPRRFAYTLSSNTVMSLSVTVSRFKRALANLFTSGKVARGRIASGGEVHTVVTPCLSLLWEVSSCSTLFTSIRITAAAAASSPRTIFVKRAWTTFVLIRTGTPRVVMCVDVWVIRWQHWMVAVKWACCAVYLWVIKCQLFVYFLSGEHLNGCRVEDESFHTKGKLLCDTWVRLAAARPSWHFIID